MIQIDEMTSSASSECETLSTDDSEAPSVENSDKGHRDLKEADSREDTDESKSHDIPSTQQSLATAVDVDETADARTGGVDDDDDRAADADKMLMVMKNSSKTMRLLILKKRKVGEKIGLFCSE